MSSMKIFSENNPNFKKINTFDLHGLQVKEALNVLKQVLIEKKSGNFFIFKYDELSYYFNI